MSHLVDQLELEVLVADPPLAGQILAGPMEARQLQERLSRLHHQVLAEVLARVLDQLSPPGTLHRLESLTLELGAIPADQLERLFPERLEQALRQTLPSRLLTAQRRPAPAADPLAQPRPDLAPTPTASDRDPPQGARPARPPQDALDPSGPPGSASADSPGPEAVSPGAEEPGRSTPRAAQEAPAPPAADSHAPPRPDQAPNPTVSDRDPLQDARPVRPPQDALDPPGPPGPVSADSSGPEAVSPGAGEPGRSPARPGQEPPGANAADPLAPIPTVSDRAPLQDARPASPPQDALDPPGPPGPASADSPGPAAVSPGAGEPARSPARPGQEAPAASPLELLASFAATGTLPWWAPRHDARLIPSTIAAALRLRPEELHPFLRQLATAPTAQQRLLAALDPPQQHALRQAWRQVTREVAIQAPPENPEPRRASSDTPDPPLDEITVDGAGLTLVWPFLERLFDRLQWLTPERRFRDAATQQRAMALLGYLVDGEPEPPEWRLTLAKLLCGAPLDAVCTLERALREEERAEAEKLLQAVLAHGDGLLGEEVATLRATWLQRPGRLRWRPQAWLLVVDPPEGGKETVARLPWSLTWIRLPWMAELVQVAW